MKDYLPWIILLVLLIGTTLTIWLMPKPDRPPLHSIITIDGCDYVQNNYQRVPIVHSGACRNHP